jgi:GT2 family glycosyltransferase
VTDPRLSIVVPTYERRESVLRLLHALERQTAAPDLFEVVIAVDGSNDGTREAIDAHAAPFALRQVWQRQCGRAAACNAGARLATGAVILFLDDDMEPSESLVAAHLARHERRSGLGVVGAAPIVVDPDATPLVRFRAGGFRRKLERLSSRGDDLAFNDVYTGNFSIPRQLFLAASGYDEEFTLYGHEDYELSLRLGRAGVNFVFDSAALAHQHYTKSVRGLAANIEEEGRTAVLFARKHPEVLPSLALGGYSGRSPRTRRRLSTVAALSRVYRALPSRLCARVEDVERRTSPWETDILFPRYRRLFDLLYWVGAERALHECGAPWFHIAIQDVGRWIAAADKEGGLPWDVREGEGHRPGDDRSSV